jgi:hypothetical protein
VYSDSLLKWQKRGFSDGLMDVSKGRLKSFDLIVYLIQEYFYETGG